MKRTFLRIAQISAAFTLLAIAYERARPDELMQQTAAQFLVSLNPDQKKRAQFPLDDMDERTHWLYTPNPRRGLALREMTAAQQQLAEALLSAGLSSQGLIKAHTIMSLDQILYVLEKDGDLERDPMKYYISVFGEPSGKSPWGYRFEGHHVSLNYTIVNGKIASTPSFFGSNPAEVLETQRKGLRVLARQQDSAQRMIDSLTPAQLAEAVTDKTAPADVLTTNSRKAALNGQPNGLAWAKLTTVQKDLLEQLVAEYAFDFPPEIAEARLAQFRKVQGQSYFAWAGGVRPGEKRYYRVQTPEFLIEFDQTQDNGNHIHSVWRDYKGDWGEDLLAAHYRSGH